MGKLSFVAGAELPKRFVGSPDLLPKSALGQRRCAPMEAASLLNCRAEFAFDGAFIDLLAPGTGPAEWEVFWTALRVGPFELRAFRDGEPIALPEAAAWIFSERERASVRVSVLSGTVTANCHFVGGDLELIDPREVISEAAFEAVLAVMRFIADVLRLPVFAVAEGGTPAYAFLRVSPDGQAAYLPWHR
jgi:hypothetical protein